MMFLYAPLLQALSKSVANAMEVVIFVTSTTETVWTFSDTVVQSTNVSVTVVITKKNMVSGETRKDTCAGENVEG